MWILIPLKIISLTTNDVHFIHWVTVFVVNSIRDFKLPNRIMFCLEGTLEGNLIANILLRPREKYFAQDGRDISWTENLQLLI